MKYGVVVFKETTNIGDDVQVYAAARFLPRVDLMLDREHLDEIVSDEPIAAVMNGWFLHRKWNWPPASCLRPFFIAFHYTDYERAKYYGKHIKTTFLDGPGLDYLKAWGPVGCRDINTLKLLETMGVESYFSGCMTLTLPQMPKTPQETKYACFVDVHTDAMKPLMEKARAEGVEPRTVSHLIDAYGEDVPWSTRAEHVEALLTLYQNASCVITSRLHCALPCLALGTPVLLVRPDLDNIRFQPYVKWMHTASVKDAKGGALAYSFADPPPNSGLHMETREKLIAAVKGFVANAQTLDQKYPMSEMERLTWQRDILRASLEENLEAYKFDVMEYERMLKGKKESLSLMQRFIVNLRLNGLAVTLRKIKSNLRKRIGA